MIPKIIHYCWFSGDPYPETALMVLDSWKMLLPNYTFKKWTLNDIDINENNFVHTAYQHKKWAFVSDYIRLKSLYEHGGIYMDLDFLLVKNLDSVLDTHCFFGCQTENLVDCAIIGSEAGHPFLKKMLDYYSELEFNIKSPVAMPAITTPLLQSEGFEKAPKFPTQIKDITFFPIEYFYSLPFPIPRNKTYVDFITEKSLGVHLWEGSWLSAKNYFNIGDCKKGRKKLREEETSFIIIKIWYWSLYCIIKNGLRPIYHFWFFDKSSE